MSNRWQVLAATCLLTALYMDSHLECIRFSEYGPVLSLSLLSSKFYSNVVLFSPSQGLPAHLLTFRHYSITKSESCTDNQNSCVASSTTSPFQNVRSTRYILLLLDDPAGEECIGCLNELNAFRVKDKLSHEVRS
jgi:hypothetical protein